MFPLAAVDRRDRWQAQPGAVSDRMCGRRSYLPRPPYDTEIWTYRGLVVYWSIFKGPWVQLRCVG